MKHSFLSIFFLSFFCNLFAQNDQRACLPCTFSGPATEFCDLEITTDSCQGDLSVCRSIISNGAQIFSYNTETQTVGVPVPTLEDITFTNDSTIDIWSYMLGDSEFIYFEVRNYLIEYNAIYRIAKVS
jgi:hypothetical protein